MEPGSVLSLSRRYSQLRGNEERNMNLKIVMGIALGSLALGGCSVINVGAYEHPPRVEMDGWVNGYAAAKGIRPWDGNIVKLNLFSHGEIISAEVWPLAEAGIGFIGARVQVLPLEIALGALFYHPEAADYWHYNMEELEKLEHEERSEPPPPPE